MLSRTSTTIFVKAALHAAAAASIFCAGIATARWLDRRDCTVTIVEQRIERIEQEPVMWASSVLGYSTQYTDESWSAEQALGMPDVFPRHGDLANAWASLSPDGQPEWIELGYAQPQRISAVQIFETYNPHAVESVELVTTSGTRIVLHPSRAIDGRGGVYQTSGAHKLIVDVNNIDLQNTQHCTTEPIAAVRINVASHVVEGWNEIDAVGLVPCPAVR